MKVREIMTPSVFTTTEKEPLESVAQSMYDRGIRHAPVLRQDDLVGILSERDIVAIRAIARDEKKSFLVEDIMEPIVEVAFEDDAIESAAARMGALRIGSLPVVDAGKKVVGILTTTDLITNQGRWEFSGAATVSGLMTEDPEVCNPDDPLLTAASRLVESHIRHIPVVDDDNVVVGMLSDRDIRTTVGDPVVALRESTWENLEGLTVGETMTRNPVTVPASTKIRDLIPVFVAEKIGAIPVVDDDGRLLGIISYIDVLDFIDKS